MHTHTYMCAHKSVDKIKKIFAYICMCVLVWYAQLTNSAKLSYICVNMYTAMWEQVKCLKAQRITYTPCWMAQRNLLSISMQCECSALRLFRFFFITFSIYPSSSHATTHTICVCSCVCLFIFIFMALHSGALCVSAHLCVCNPLCPSRHSHLLHYNKLY